MTDSQQLFDDILAPLAALPNVTRGKMFGALCAKVNGKAFIMFHKDAAVFKLAPADRAEALGIADARLFDPMGMGRAMKEWVEVPFSQRDHWDNLTEQAMAYVTSITA